MDFGLFISYSLIIMVFIIIIILYIIKIFNNIIVLKTT